MCKKPEPKPHEKEVSSSDDDDSVAESSPKEDTSFPAVAPTHSAKDRNTDYDWLIFLGPALFAKFTPVWTIYAIAIARIATTHLILSLHYQFVDKDNYFNKLTQKQLRREKDDYLTGFYLHMYTQIALQLIFPSMFFSPNEQIWSCAKEVFLSHVLVVEPLYYLAHRWLHVPKQMKAMHGFHHLSIHTLPSTSLVQNFHEHFVYLAVFGPAFMLPFLLQGRQHWAVVGAYLVAFDAINAWGHTNVQIRSWFLTSPWSPLTYLFYTPEFHLGHHAYFNANYGLFMPLWDRLLGTYREYHKKPRAMLPADQQDFVFIGHNGGFGHFLTIPEISVYNVFDQYLLTGLPLKLEFFLMHLVAQVCRLFMSFYYCSRTCVANEFVARTIVLVRTPWDYMSGPSRFDAINREMLQLMRNEHQKYGTRKFGLGNLNKMKQLNDGGMDLTNMIAQDEYLHDKNIRVWTGDTMTVASVYNQIVDVPNLDRLFYIGAGGKVGTAVCELLTTSRPGLKICIFSRHRVLNHPNISYTNNLSDMADYRVVLVGKILSNAMYEKALRTVDQVQTRFMLDYTVPVLPIPALESRGVGMIRHIRIGLLQTRPNNAFLKGHYDWCMSHGENQIVPCHFGCLLNTVNGRETNEVGEINPLQVEQLWKQANARGFYNIPIDYQT
jgi:sterol desaturase/sphingolipid hydroxylase (fatty acid hydroxylase superfamily)